MFSSTVYMFAVRVFAVRPVRKVTRLSWCFLWLGKMQALLGRVLFAAIFCSSALNKATNFGTDGGPVLEYVSPKLEAFKAQVQAVTGFSLDALPIEARQPTPVHLLNARGTAGKSAGALTLTRGKEQALPRCRLCPREHWSSALRSQRRGESLRRLLTLNSPSSVQGWSHFSVGFHRARHPVSFHRAVLLSQLTLPAASCTTSGTWSLSLRPLWLRWVCVAWAKAGAGLNHSLLTPAAVNFWKNVALAGALLTWLSMKQALSDRAISKKLKSL